MVGSGIDARSVFGSMHPSLRKAFIFLRTYFTTLFIQDFFENNRDETKFPKSSSVSSKKGQIDSNRLYTVRGKALGQFRKYCSYVKRF